MSADTDLRALLAGTSAITALVSTRIVADRMEEGAVRPFVVFSRVATEHQYGLDGTVHASRATFDVQCWADTRISAEAVADAIETVLATNQRPVLSRVSGYDAELDLEATLLTVEWWD
jgi:methylaspartate ammonia-lyase